MLILGVFFVTHSRDFQILLAGRHFTETTVFSGTLSWEVDKTSTKVNAKKLRSFGKKHGHLQRQLIQSLLHL